MTVVFMTSKPNIKSVELEILTNFICIFVTSTGLSAVDGLRLHKGLILAKFDKRLIPVFIDRTNKKTIYE